MNTKRPATKDEVDFAMKVLTQSVGVFEETRLTEQEVRHRNTLAEQEGFTNETCSCGVVFLASRRDMVCRLQGCPFM